MPKTEGTFLPPRTKATGIKTQNKRGPNPHTVKPLPKRLNTGLCINPYLDSEQK
jgi:hypothetical protein